MPSAGCLSRISIYVGLCFPFAAFAGTADPTGVAGLLVVLATLAPLIPCVIVGVLFVCAVRGGKGVLSGVGVGVTIYLVGLAYFARSAKHEGDERRARAELRELGIADCQKDLPSVADEYLVDSLLVESGVIEKNTLIRLLGGRGLKFVEMKAKVLKGEMKGEAKGSDEWGVVSVNGDSSVRLLLPRAASIARVSLASKSGRECVEQPVLGMNLSSPSMPFSPDTCIQVDMLTESGASHALKAIPIDSRPGYIKWSLVEQTSGKVLLGLTSNDAPEAPMRQRGGNHNEYKTVKNGMVSCRQPHFSLMSALRSEPKHVFPRLALVERVVDAEISSGFEELTNWRELDVDAEQIFDWGDKTGKHKWKSPWGEDWSEAFKAAERAGWSVIGDKYIDYKAGEVVSIELPKDMADLLSHGYTAATKNGFIFVSRIGKVPRALGGLGIVSFSRSGKVLWQGVLKFRPKYTEELRGFDPVVVSFENAQIQVYGHVGQSPNARVWMLKFPVKAVGLDS